MLGAAGKTYRGPDGWKRPQHARAVRIADFYTRGGETTSSVDRYRVSLARARIKALDDARREERLVRAGGNEVIGIEEMAETLGRSTKQIRRRIHAGELLGAYLERGRWCIRRRDLWAHLGLHAERLIDEALVERERWKEEAEGGA